MAGKVMLIGLDCAEPSLVEAWRDELPTLSGLMERGVHGRLTSIVPPITVPAWSCMMASRTPGDLGVYGFRNRSDHTYDGAVHRRLRPRSRRRASGTSSGARAARRSCSAFPAPIRRGRCGA